MSVIFIIEILSGISVVSYYLINIYLTLRRDAVHDRVVKYAWFHIRDKWKGKAHKAYDSALSLIHI